MPASTFNGDAVKILKNTLRFKDGTNLTSADAASINTTVTSIVNTDSPYSLTSSTRTLLCDTSSGAITVNLPAASGNSGLSFIIKLTTSGNTLTIDGNASETIDGATAHELRADSEFVKIVCDGTNWQIVAAHYTELVESSANPSSYTITAGTYGDLTSISLAPGEYDIFLQISWFNAGGAVTTTNINCGLHTTSGNSSPPGGHGIDAAGGIAIQSSSARYELSLSMPGVSVSSTTTHYLKARVDNSITNLSAGYKISARRVS